jgi:tetratricopeptide (TPR) repeat protein
MRCRSVAVPRAKASKAKAAKPKRAPEPAAELPVTHSEQALVDRYYAMAEELNGRGSMELAVPFYRQTIALLLAEREQLRALIGQKHVPLESSADVEGVMAAAFQVETGQEALTLEEMLRQLTSLEEELTLESHQEVLAALHALQQQWGAPHAQLLGLEAKIKLILEDFESAKDLFEQALSLDPACVRLRFNTGSARFVCGDSELALKLLRPLLKEQKALAHIDALSSFWNNLIQAELTVGELQRAISGLCCWLDQCGSAVDPQPWREIAQQLLASDDHDSAQLLLHTFAEHGSHDQRRAVLPDLAELLERNGEFRQAALLYRELLRPGLTR